MRVLLVALVLVGCVDDGGGGGGGDGGPRDTNATVDTSPGGNLVDGTLMPVGGTPPAMGKTFVLWSSDIGQGDFLYKYGEGTATMTTFTANVTPPVPNDATFGGLLGVGIVALLPSSATLADGVVPDNYLQSNILGYTGRYAIIFRPNANPVPEATWVNDFPVGLSCGRCTDQTQGFDTFVPVPCTEMVLQVGTLQQVQGCNWT